MPESPFTRDLKFCHFICLISFSTLAVFSFNLKKINFFKRSFSARMYIYICISFTTENQCMLLWTLTLECECFWITCDNGKCLFRNWTPKKEDIYMVRNSSLRGANLLFHDAAMRKKLKEFSYGDIYIYFFLHSAKDKVRFVICFSIPFCYRFFACKKLIFFL